MSEPASPLTLEELLAGHAAGSLPPPLALVVATHLALSPASRQLYTCYEAAGGVLLERIDPIPLAPDAWHRLRDRLGDPRAVREPLPSPSHPPTPGALRRIPRPLRDHIPGSLDRLRWRSLGSASEAEIDLGTPGYRTILLRVRAGRAVPRHTHEGNELTLVLEGSYHDEFGRYQRGDLSISDSSIDHRPTADKGEDCLCLTVTDGRLRLTGPFGRLLNPFLRG